MSASTQAVSIEAANLTRDGDSLVALNNAAVPAVNDITVADLAYFADHGDVIAARVDGEIAGLLVLLPAGVAYDSDNYRWFCERYVSFLYVDRVVVGPHTRGLGVGRTLYERAISNVRSRGGDVLLAEVNTRPPNPGSIAFHARMGFSPLEERENPVSGKRVLMHERRVGTRAPRRNPQPK